MLLLYTGDLTGVTIFGHLTTIKRPSGSDQLMSILHFDWRSWQCLANQQIDQFSSQKWWWDWHRRSTDFLCGSEQDHNDEIDRRSTDFPEKINNPPREEMSTEMEESKRELEEVTKEVIQNEAQTTNDVSMSWRSTMFDWAMDVNQFVALSYSYLLTKLLPTLIPLQSPSPHHTPTPTSNINSTALSVSKVCSTSSKPLVPFASQEPTPSLLDNPVTPQPICALPKPAGTPSNGKVAQSATTKHVDCTSIVLLVFWRSQKKLDI